MSTVETAAPETNATTRRSTVPGKRVGESAAPGLPEAGRNAEAAVTELMTATTETLRAFVPAAVLRPSTTMGYGFDLAEQLLSNTRRACLEMARIVETGIDNLGQRAA